MNPVSGSVDNNITEEAANALDIFDKSAVQNQEKETAESVAEKSSAPAETAAQKPASQSAPESVETPAPQHS